MPNTAAGIVAQRFMRASRPEDVRCACRKYLSQHARTVGAALVLCKACGAWLYSVAPRVGDSFEVEHVLTYAVTTDEMLEIERGRLNPLEALLLLGVLNPEQLLGYAAFRPAIRIAIPTAGVADDVLVARGVLQTAGASEEPRVP